MVTVYGIVPGSEADKVGIKVGDKLYTVNGTEINDVLDYRFYLTDKKVVLSLGRDGGEYQVEIHKEMYADIGLEFETYLMDKKHSCRNRCIFCFIDQLPKGMRETLYFKDDDSRLSFLMGNYITLTNLKDSDIDRIIKMHISPVNVSVHTTNPELRVQMMKNKRAGEVLKYLDRLAEAGIELNCQIVLCNGINDGEELKRTMFDLAELNALRDAVNSVSVVPSGLTRFREKLYPLEPFTPEQCREVINAVTEFGDACIERYGKRLFFCGDEFYLKGDVPFPKEEFYEGYPQIENGVGMITSMQTEFDWAAEDIEAEPDEKSTVKRTVSVATGFAAYDFIRQLADRTEKLFDGLKVNVYKIRNDFFGENITVAGLLTGQDILAQLKPYAEKGELGEKLILPKVTLRSEGDLFLDGMTPEQLSKELGGIKIIFNQSEGEAFIDALTSE